jgi:beta-glucanase (GH16 family)
MILHGALFYLLLIGGIPAGAEDWKLAWSDEFDRPGLPDPEKWSSEEGFVRNSELQYYTRAKADNARVVDGMLVLEARKEQLVNPAFDPNAKDGWKRTRKVAEYTSAGIMTRGKAAWTYGRIEVRAKLPTGKGMWPAIWMLGSDQNQGWPACGEIDIMENVGFDPDVIHANIHTKKYNHVMRTNKGDKVTIAKPYEDFHNYAIEWNPDRIDFFVDDLKYFTYANEGSGPDAWPFDKDQYLILNIAVGGDWGGQQGIDDSKFPQRMYVDYVRVYQKTAKAQDPPR